MDINLLPSPSLNGNLLEMHFIMLESLSEQVIGDCDNEPKTPFLLIRICSCANKFGAYFGKKTFNLFSFLCNFILKVRFFF